MNELPEPLTPTDCDLRDFQFMPLDVVRLRDSDIAVMVSGEEFRSAVMLWCAAWHQVPAGSLPNDDRSLASLAGYGRAVGEWLKVKEGALRGWIECADARLYHPVVCEKARESWDSKLQHAYDKLVDRLRKLNKRREESGLPVVVCPPFDVWKSIGRPLESKLISTGNDDSFQRKGGDVPPDGQRNDIGRAGPDDSDSGGFGDGDAAQSAHSINSGGSEDVSAGNAGAFQRNAPQIPPEKALKGQVREGTGKGEVKNPPSSNGGGTPRANDFDDDHVPKAPVEWAKFFDAEHGVQTDTYTARGREKLWPLAQGWIDAGLSIGRMRAAIAKAKADTTEPIMYLPSYVNQVLVNAQTRAARPPKPVPLHSMDDNALNAEGRKHGLEARPGEDRHAFIGRIQTAQAIEQGRVAA